MRGNRTFVISPVVFLRFRKILFNGIYTRLYLNNGKSRINVYYIVSLFELFKVILYPMDRSNSIDSIGTINRVKHTWHQDDLRQCCDVDSSSISFEHFEKTFLFSILDRFLQFVCTNTEPYCTLSTSISVKMERKLLSKFSFICRIHFI